MKLIFVVRLTALLVLTKQVFGEIRSSLLSKAFANITDALVTSSTLVSVITVGSDLKSVTSAVLKQSFTVGEPQYVRNFTTFEEDVGLNNSAIVLVESMSQLIEFNENVNLTNNYSTPFQFFVYCHGATLEEISRLEENKETENIFQFEYFIIDQEDYIQLMTFVWHTKTECHRPQLFEVNRFAKTSLKWEKDDFKLNKFENFHRCTLTFEFVPIFPSFAPKSYNQAGDVYQCSGFLCEASNAISNNLNIRVKMKVSVGGPCAFNSSFCWFIQPSIVERHPGFFVTQTFMSFDDSIAVPPPGTYNAYEKLLMPFDEATWLSIAFTFAFLFGAIIALRFARPGIRNVVLGKQTKAPALDVLRAFFGISQIKTPSKHFARFLLLIVIFSSLIIRTAYQGKMFEFMNKEILKPNVKSIKEMIDKNFTFFVTSGFTDIFNKTHYFSS